MVESTCAVATVPCYHYDQTQFRYENINSCNQSLCFALEMLASLFFRANVITAKNIEGNSALVSVLATGLKVGFDFCGLYRKGPVDVNHVRSLEISDLTFCLLINVIACGLRCSSPKETCSSLLALATQIA